MSLLSRRIRLYKSIYILNTEVNTAFGKILIPFIKAVVISAFVSSTFAICRLYKSMDLVSICFIVDLAVSTLLTLIPISVVMSNLHDLSLIFHHNLSLELFVLPNCQEKRSLEKELRSCASIRCNVGSFYYMEAEAKLTILHTIVNGIVFLFANT